MAIIIGNPGMSTTVEDLGRNGAMRWGFSHSGAVDRRAAIIANILVENPANTPLLEFAMLGPTLTFTRDAVFALTGGRFQAKLDDVSVTPYTATVAKAGSQLRVGFGITGNYGYLAFAGGGIDVPLILGSASTDSVGNIGGIDGTGRFLVQGDCLTLKDDLDEERGSNRNVFPNLLGHTLPYDPIYTPTEGSTVMLRVIPGPQEDAFTEAGITSFYGKVFFATSQNNRLGFRLNGPSIETKHGSDIISEGVALGAVQVPASGRPIIMMSERRTTGGYAKIGTVASVDIPKLAQCRPSTPIRFKRIGVREAQQLCRDEAAYYQSLRKQMHKPYLGDIPTRTVYRRLSNLIIPAPDPGKGKSKILASMGRSTQWK